MLVKRNKQTNKQNPQKSVIKDLFTSLSLHATLMKMNPINTEKREQHYSEQ